MGADLRAQRMRLTDHAIDRYQKHWAPHLAREDAHKVLASIVTAGARLKKRTLPREGELWASGDVQFVVKRDPGENIAVVVTVLSKSVSAANDVHDLDIFNEWVEEQSELISDAHEKDLQRVSVELEVAIRDKADAEALVHAGKEWQAEANRRILSARDRITWLKRQTPQVRT